MISVERRKCITVLLSFCLTRAPMTPREVRRRYSKGRVLEVVFKRDTRKGVYVRSRRVVVSRDEMRRIGGAQGHCRRG